MFDDTTADLDPQTSGDFWDAYLSAAEADALLISDAELAMISEDIDTWHEDPEPFDVIAFEDGLGFDVPAWPDMSDDDANAEAPF